MKKFILGTIVCLFAFVLIRPVTTQAVSFTNLDGKEGKVEVEISTKDKDYYKLEVKTGTSVRHYDVYKGKNHFNLVFGNGNYTLTLFRSADGKKYKKVMTEQLPVKLRLSTAPYLHTTQNVFIDAPTAKLAKTLKRASYSTSKQIQVTSRHVNQKIAYDYEKVGTLSASYIPSNDDTLKMRRGICFDFASLNGALLRAQGIPTRLVMGYATGIKGYHAWNEVYLDKKWVVVDVTRDVTEKKVSNIRSNHGYRATSYY